MDVLWFRLSRHPQEIDMPLGRITPGRIFVMLNRDQYWQCALVIQKGGFDQLRAAGLEVFRQTITNAAPPVQDRVQEIQDWKQVSLLTVLVNRLTQWSLPGLLCIGDAAHAMSPIGGVGINLAIQDAVAAANLLVQPLRDNRLTADDLTKVQKRRTWPVIATQRLQLFIQNRVIRNVLSGEATMKIPWYLKLFNRWPVLRRIPARLVGVGVRPEHIRTRAVQ
jgi:2-polyprenyl-6-methoxyphenol hydroxylase-like FAD-dependent oxidoreductase